MNTIREKLETLFVATAMAEERDLLSHKDGLLAKLNSAFAEIALAEEGTYGGAASAETRKLWAPSHSSPVRKRAKGGRRIHTKVR